MENNFIRALVFGAAGLLVGSSMGVVAFGGGVSGALVFGPVGFVLGWLIPWRTSTPSSPFSTATPHDPLSEGPPPPSPRSNFGEVEDAINKMLPIAGRGLAAIWNMQMRFLIAVGVMPFMQRYPWALVAIGFVLLAVLFPLGVVFAVTGVAAMNLSANARNQFLVDLENREP